LFGIVTTTARAETWRIYENARFGTTIEYPDRFVAGKPPENGDGLSFSSADGSSFSVWGSHNSLDHNLAQQEAFFRKILQEDGAIITYRASRENWFVLSGTQGDKTFYVRELLSNRNNTRLIHGFKIVYPSRLDKAYDPIVTRMSHSLRESPNALEVQTGRTAKSDLVGGANVYIQKGEGGASLDAWLEMDESNQLSLAIMDCVRKGKGLSAQLALRVVQEKPVAELEKLRGETNDTMELFLCLNAVCEKREWKFLESGFGAMFSTDLFISRRHESVRSIRVIIPQERVKYEYRGDVDGILKKVCR